MATHSSILAWTISWTEEPGRLQSMGLPRVGHNLVTKPPQFLILWFYPQTSWTSLSFLSSVSSLVTRSIIGPQGYGCVCVCIYMYIYYMCMLIYVYLFRCASLSCSMWGLSCSMWDPAPWPGIEPRCLALGSWGLSHWNQWSPQASGFSSAFQDLFLFTAVASRKHSSQGSVSSLPPSSVFLLSLCFSSAGFSRVLFLCPNWHMSVSHVPLYSVFCHSYLHILPRQFHPLPWHQLPCRFWKTLYATSLQRFLFGWFWIAREILEFHSWVPKPGSSPFPDVGIISDLSSLNCCAIISGHLQFASGGYLLSLSAFLP